MWAVCGVQFVNKRVLLDVQEDGYTEADDIDDTEIPQDSQAGYPYAYEDEPVASSSTYGGYIYMNITLKYG